MPRVVLLVTSPRLPAGLLSAPAWDVLRNHPVLAAERSGQCAAVEAAGVQVKLVNPTAAAVLAELADHDAVVWLSSPGGDEELARELGLRLARDPGLAELELMYGSWDPPGARLLDVVAVMDRLVSPGGDPWKHSQTHRSLAKYLLEEAYEAYDALLADDLTAVREELGDVLLQVALHARMAEDAAEPWSVDDLAAGLVAKLVRRNPHVFGSAELRDLDEIEANWEQIKKAEKPHASAFEGISLTQPALALAAKVISRGRAAVEPSRVDSEDELGRALLALVAGAQASGLDAEGALRAAVLRLIRAAEEPPAG